jgi:hypothetical protein
MKEPEKEIIRNHPYFLGEENNIFYLKKEKERYEINLTFAFKEDYPIIWNNLLDGKLTIWQAESWFQELYIKVNEIYFQKNRVRLLMKGERRSLENIIIFSCIGKENGEQLNHLLEEIMVFEKRYIPKEYELLLNCVKETAENERYKVIVKEENEQEFSLTIY